MAPNLSSPSAACALTRLRVRLFVGGITISPGFSFLGSIFPVVVGAGLALGCEHHCACKEEERFVRDCLAGSPRLFFCTLGHTYILRDPLYFKVIALNLIMKRQEVEGLATGAPHLEVGEERLSRDVGVECL